MHITSKEEDIMLGKLGFLQATVDFVLKRQELRDEFIEFLKTKSDYV